MKNLIFNFTIALALISTTISASYKNTDSVHVNWKTGEILAKTFYSAQYDENGVPVDFASSGASTPTSAKIAAYEKSKESAVELIADSLKGLEIENGETIEKLISSNGYAAAEISRILSDKIRTKESPAGFLGARCDAKLKIAEVIRALPFEYPNLEIPVRENPLATEYTSLIIDMRGHGVKPVIFPSIFDEKGIEIFSKKFINPRAASKEGIIAYCYNESEAKIHPKAGDKPYFTQVIRINNNSPVLSDRDTRKILGHKKTVDKLKICRVIFIIDETKRSMEKHQ